jgi:hypothetical protein
MFRSRVLICVVTAHMGLESKGQGGHRRVAGAFFTTPSSGGQDTFEWFSRIGIGIGSGNGSGDGSRSGEGESGPEVSRV